MDYRECARPSALAFVGCITATVRDRWHRSAVSLFDAGVELRSQRPRALELSCGEPGDSCICGAGAVWDCAPYTPRAAITRAFRDARERSGGGNCDPLGRTSAANRKRDLRHPANGILDGFVFAADLVLRDSRS